jgi:hypothetical protein
MLTRHGVDIFVDVVIFILLTLAASGCEKPTCHYEYRYKNTLQQDINAQKVCEGMHGK